MEIYANEAGGVLDGAINSSVTTITIKSAVNAPASGTFRARIDDEYLTVTNVSGSGLTWTVVRGAEGSTAASHNDNAAVYVIITAAALDSIVSIQAAGTEVSNRRTLNFTGAAVTDDAGNGRVNISIGNGAEPIVAPVLANFTFDGHSIAGTPTATQQGSTIYLHHPGTSGDANIELYQAAPATPYTVVAKIIPFGLVWGATQAGLYLSDGTKLSRLGVQLSNNQVIQDRYNAWNAFGGSIQFGGTNSLFSRVVWFRITNNGTTKTYAFGPDGFHWIQTWSETAATFLTPTRVGVFLNGNTGGANNGRIAGAILESWQVT